MKLLDRVREALRVRQYSLHTEEAYVRWIKRFILFHDRRHPQTMDVPEIEAFLTHLAVDQNMAASTQTQALGALLFLYREVLQTELSGPIDRVRAKQPGQRVPTVLTRDQVRRLLDALPGSAPTQLVVRLLYGAGLRLIEALRLRVGDLDIDHRQITVRARKGAVDHVTMLPASLVQPLRQQLRHVKAVHMGYTRPSNAPHTAPVLRSTSRLTSLDTPSPRTYLKMATTSAPSRNSWATKTSRPP